MINEPTFAGIPIRTGAKAVAILGIIFTVLIFIAAFSTGIFWLLLWIIYFLPNYAIIYAVIKDKSWAYLPYLIMNFFGPLYFYAIKIFGKLISLQVVIPFITDKRDNNAAGFILFIIMLTLCILYVYSYMVIYRAYTFTKDFIEPSRKSPRQEQMNSTTSKPLSIQHPGVVNGNTCPSYNAYTCPGQGQPYPQKIDIPIGFVNSYTECLEQTGAKAVAILGIVFTVLIIILALCTGNFWLLLMIILFIPNYAIIYAVTKDKSWAYLPYLILNIIGMIYSVLQIFGTLLSLLFGIPILITDKRYNHDAAAEIAVYILITIIILAVYILYIYFYVVIYRAYTFTKYFLEPSRKSFGQEQINNTTSITQSIQHPGVINGNTVYPSYNASAYPGQGHPYPQQIDIPIGFVNSYTECLEQPPSYQLHYPATNQPTHTAPNARKDIVSP